jgi:hypothetical protein
VRLPRRSTAVMLLCMTEPPSGRPADPQPRGADKAHTPGDYAAGGYDDRQDSGDASAEESRVRETGGAEEPSQHGGREPVRPGKGTEGFDATP